MQNIRKCQYSNTFKLKSELFFVTFGIQNVHILADREAFKDQGWTFQQDTLSKAITILALHLD